MAMAHDMVQRSKAPSVVILLAGIWTIIAAYTLGGSAAAEWSGVVVGILFIICSIGRMAAPGARGFSVANIVWSIWLIISPWTFASRTALHWSNDVTGIIALICAIAALRQTPKVAVMPDTGYGPSQRAA